MPSSVEWLERIERFGIKLGLERMEALMERLGNPQTRFRSIHVLGTNGKTSVTRTAEALLLAEGVNVGAYTSPHVTEWAERIRIGGRECDFGAAIERVRPHAEELEATQFEVLTAAALAEFAAGGVEVAVIEAGLGGRLDATNVIGAPVVVLTNVALEHTQHLGPTREQIAGEKLAVVRPGATVVLGEPEWAGAAAARSAERVIVEESGNADLAHAAVEALLGRSVDRTAADAVRVPGRLERRGDAPLEIWDGAHNPAGVSYLLNHLPGGDDWTLVLSISDDKDAETMLAALSVLGERVVVTASTHGRPFAADVLGDRARRVFPHVEVVPEPAAALERARELAGEDGAVLVTGSLYLLESLNSVRPATVRWDT
jgi:dihydrofolate synthase / folylpolyglutamate synthase